MAKITIVPNVGKGSDTGGINVTWKAIPNVGDSVNWEFRGAEAMRTARGVVKHREFKSNGDVTLSVTRTGRLV